MTSYIIVIALKFLTRLYNQHPLQMVVHGVGEIGVSAGDNHDPPSACAFIWVTSPLLGDIVTGVPTCPIGECATNTTISRTLFSA